MNLWEKNIPQAEITLKLLRPYHIKPSLLAYTQVYGAFDHSKIPLALPDIRVQAHVISEQKKLWAPHVVEVPTLGQPSTIFIMPSYLVHKN